MQPVAPRLVGVAEVPPTLLLPPPLPQTLLSRFVLYLPCGIWYNDLVDHAIQWFQVGSGGAADAVF